MRSFVFMMLFCFFIYSIKVFHFIDKIWSVCQRWLDKYTVDFSLFSNDHKNVYYATLKNYYWELSVKNTFIKPVFCNVPRFTHHENYN